MRSVCHRIWLGGLVALLALTPLSRADSITLWPDADTTLLEFYPDNNLGGAPFFNAGTTQNGPRNHGLLRFNIATNLPPGAHLLRAELTLQVTRQPKDGFTGASMELHRVLRAWGEGTEISLESNHPGTGSPAATNEATWNYRFAGTTNTWAIPGGAAGIDYATNISSEQFIYDVGNSPYTFPSSAPAIADAQFWLDHPEQNFGWMLKGTDEEARFTARRYASREDPNEDSRPVLYLEFVPPPRIESIALDHGKVLLSFTIAAGFALGVDTSTAFSQTNVWQRLTNFPVASSNTLITLTNSVSGISRFYRLSDSF